MTASKPPEQREEQKQEKWYERTRYQLLLYVAGIIIFVLVLWLALDSYMDPRTSSQKKDLVQALALILAGVAAAIGIFFTWRGQRITRIGQDMTQQNTQAQLQLTRESLQSTQKDTEQQLRLTQQGQITERFTRAIDQLGATDDEGNKLFEIRIGGIYALERIARESEEDYWPIMEILTAYVRQHARVRPQEVQGTTGPDIQAIVTVLRRRTRFLGHGEPEPLDLRRTNLWGANLTGANLTGADLTRANLRGVNLRGANLTRANLTGANLTGAALRGANLTWVVLTGANLTGADLTGADLDSADLSKANLTGANLLGADFVNQELLDSTRSGDENTRLPSGLKPPAHWRGKTDEQPEGD